MGEVRCGRVVVGLLVRLCWVRWKTMLVFLVVNVKFD